MNQHDRLNDELLVLRCQEGDTEAFELLVARWQQRLWRHAWRLTGNESAAWDVLQEAWIGISRGINRLVDAAAFPAWAYQIISNKCRTRFVANNGDARPRRLMPSGCSTKSKKPWLFSSSTTA
ncbi:MAG: RNA polymerase sigma factor [Thermoguttaceae bacterium]